MANERNEQSIGETKLVSLCEDMNFHEHDSDSYEKQKSIQDKRLDDFLRAERIKDMHANN